MISGIQAFYHGLLLGLVFLVSFGPIFFAIIETSINRGFWAAASIALGAMLSDASYIMLSFLGVTAFLESEKIHFIIGIAGGIVLLIIGAFTFIKKPKIERVQLVVPNGFGYLSYGAKGFLINTLNPFVFIFWLSSMSIVSVEYPDSRPDRLIFFAGTIFVIFSSDLLKAFVANKIKLLLNERLMTWFNRIAGSVMIYFGVELMWKVF
ncbi:MAG: LysE family translocator, partial [Bacteroidota bacterium]